MCCHVGVRIIRDPKPVCMRLLPTRFIEPWQVLETGFSQRDVQFLLGNRYVLLKADEASTVSFAHLDQERKAVTMATHHLT